MMVVDHINKGTYTGQWETEYKNGYPFLVWRPIMPRIPDDELNCSIYLYPTKQDAECGANYGGSGFLMAIQSKVYPGVPHLYAVTNSHVIRKGQSPVVRIATLGGVTVIANCNDYDWKHHPDADDVAVCFIPIKGRNLTLSAIGAETFVTPNIIAEEAIGPGDETYMIGRFVGHDGKQRNLPSVRFGNISMMPNEPIYHGTRGINQESFIVETRSLSGYSGSPVFVYNQPLFPRPNQKEQSTKILRYLLGIDWCHIANYKPVLANDKRTPVEDGYFVESNSGMAGVIPAWKIMELINIEEKAIEKMEKKHKEVNMPEVPVVLDVLSSDGVTQSDFYNALKKVSHRIKSGSKQL